MSIYFDQMTIQIFLYINCKIIMAQNELEELVKRVAYMFYDGAPLMVLIGLLDVWEPIIDDELSKRLKFRKQDLCKALGKLQNDGLITVEQRENLEDVEDPDSLKPSQRKKLMRDFWSLDYKSFVDSVNLKIHMIKDKLKASSEGQYYECPRCKREDGGRNGTSTKYQYELGEIVSGFDDEDEATLKCPRCQTEMVEVEETADVNARKRREKEFNEIVAPLLDIISRTKGLVMEDDPEKRCRADQMMRKETYNAERERIKQERERRRVIQSSHYQAPVRRDIGEGGKVDIQVNTDSQAVALRPKIEEELDKILLEPSKTTQEFQQAESTITINGKEYTSSQITDELLESLPDEEYDRVMAWREKNA